MATVYRVCWGYWGKKLCASLKLQTDAPTLNGVWVLVPYRVSQGYDCIELVAQTFLFMTSPSFVLLINSGLTIVLNAPFIPTPLGFPTLVSVGSLFS